MKLNTVLLKIYFQMDVGMEEQQKMSNKISE